jgi:hypothetical protein
VSILILTTTLHENVIKGKIQKSTQTCLYILRKLGELEMSWDLCFPKMQGMSYSKVPR